MKFKLWEKIYWGIISALFILGVIMTLFHKGDVPVTVQGEQKLFSKGVFIGYSLLGYAIIFVPIWLLVRWIVNRNDKERERERERERESKSSHQSNSTENIQQQTESNQTSEQESTYQEPLYCSECHLEIPPKRTYYYDTKKKDGFKFCSQNCYTNFYGEDCIKCWKKFLMVYLIKEDNNPNHTYCWDCRKEIIKERKELSKKYCETCKIELTEKNEWNNFICKSCKEKEVDEMLRKSYGKNKEANLENEQNRTPTIHLRRLTLTR